MNDTAPHCGFRSAPNSRARRIKEANTVLVKMERTSVTNEAS
jgi:hypothetical protein